MREDIDPKSSERQRVSVVVPCYNAGAFLGETIRSLTEEEPHELIVVDDGSTDAATLRELDRTREAGALVIRQDNTGECGARHTGARRATAPYVFFLDADDLVVRGAITELADVLDTHPEHAVCWGDHIEFGAHDAYGRKAPQLDPWLQTYVNVLPQSIMIRRELLLSIDEWGFDAPYGDWDLVMSICERGWSGVGIQRPTVRYRVHEGGKLASVQRRHADAIGVLRSRHPSLFRARASNRGASFVHPVARVGLGLIEFLPGLSSWRRHRLSSTVLQWSEPRVRWRRLDEPTSHPGINAVRRRARALSARISRTLGSGRRSID